MEQCFHYFETVIHDNINLFGSVIPGLTRNPVFSWILAFAGMTTLAGIKVAVYNNNHQPSMIADQELLENPDHETEYLFPDLFCD